MTIKICATCGVSTTPASSRGVQRALLVREEIFSTAALDGYICVRCIEQRIGRQLTDADYEPASANNGGQS